MGFATLHGDDKGLLKRCRQSVHEGKGGKEGTEQAVSRQFVLFLSDNTSLGNGLSLA